MEAALTAHFSALKERLDLAREDAAWFTSWVVTMIRGRVITPDQILGRQGARYTSATPERDRATLEGLKGTLKGQGPPARTAGQYN